MTPSLQHMLWPTRRTSKWSGKWQKQYIHLSENNQFWFVRLGQIILSDDFKAQDWQTLLWLSSPHNLSNEWESKAWRRSLNICNVTLLLRNKKSKRKQGDRYSCIYGQTDSSCTLLGKWTRADPLGLAITSHKVAWCFPYSPALLGSPPHCRHLSFCQIPAWGSIDPSRRGDPTDGLCCPRSMSCHSSAFPRTGFPPQVLHIGDILQDVFDL